jgi:predicted GTPase
LLHKPEIVVLNKVDLLESDPALVERACKKLRERLHQIRGREPRAGEPFAISAVSGEGLQPILRETFEFVKQSRRERNPKGMVDPSTLPPDHDRLRSHTSTSGKSSGDSNE